MQNFYPRILQLMLASGDRLLGRAGAIEDVGVMKKWLTEEDVRIERELKKLIQEKYPDHQFFSEEENDHFIDGEDVWVADPISGTRTFIEGHPHYAIVIAHLHQQQVQFAAVYDPSVRELFTAYRGKGAFLNDRPLKVKPSSSDPKVVFAIAPNWRDKMIRTDLFAEFKPFEVYRTRNSSAVNDCWVACGRFQGSVELGRDSFPAFASSLILQEAGGIYTNIDGEANIKPSDRIFTGGDRETHEKLKPLVKKIFGG